MDPFGALPDDLLAAVLSYLPLASLVMTMTVSRRWRDVGRTAAVWQRIVDASGERCLPGQTAYAWVAGRLCLRCRRLVDDLGQCSRCTSLQLRIASMKTLRRDITREIFGVEEMVRRWTPDQFRSPDDWEWHMRLARMLSLSIQRQYDEVVSGLADVEQALCERTVL